MAKGNHREPVFDQKHRHIGDIDLGHDDTHKPPRKIARTLLINIAAVGIGCFLATPTGRQALDWVVERIAPPTNVGR